jgi:hypothetical protein
VSISNVVVGIIRVKSRNALRINSRRTWRHSEGSRNVHHTAIRRALSPSHPSGSVTAGVQADPEAWHRSGTTPRAGTSRGRIREEKRPNRCTIPRDALPARLSYFRLLAMASPQLDARWKLLI